MNIEFAELIKNQFCANWEDARGLVLTNPKLLSVHQSLDNIYHFIKDRSFVEPLPDRQKQGISILYEMFARWTEILHSDPLNSTHLEISKVLEKIAREWLGAQMDEYVITLSEGEYAFKSLCCDLSVLNSFTDPAWGAHFDYYLVELYAPRYFYEDVFTNIVLFHEIGHFVDAIKHVSDDVFSELEPTLLDNSLNSQLIAESFPYLTITGYDRDRDEKKVRSHISEYFADIFGAQYAGVHIMNHVLRREDARLDKEDPEHPSCNQRLAMVNEFLTCCQANTATTNILLAKILDIAKDDSGQPMNIHYGTINKTNIVHGQKVTIQDDAQLYAIFPTVWNLYLKNLAFFQRANQNKQWTLKKATLYKKLNRVAKDSINTYL